jgi:hypothetical protein
VGDDDALGGFGPGAGFDEALIHLESFEDYGGAGLCVINGFEEAFEDRPEKICSFVEELEKVGVAIDGGAMAEIVAPDEFVGFAPAKDIVVDLVEIRVKADFAAAHVTLEGDFFRRFWRAWFALPFSIFTDRNVCAT